METTFTFTGPHHHGSFGRGFGGGFGSGHGHGPHGGRRMRGRHRHGRRGDVRAAILLLLAERPMHGYEMIQQIAERSEDLWRPSPGSIYPTLQLLRDEGLVTATKSGGGRRLFELTEEGRTEAGQVETPPWQSIIEGTDRGQIELRAAVDQLYGAVVQAAQVATTEQQQRIVTILDGARREVYGILGEAE